MFCRYFKYWTWWCFSLILLLFEFLHLLLLLIIWLSFTTFALLLYFCIFLISIGIYYTFCPCYFTKTLALSDVFPNIYTQHFENWCRQFKTFRHSPSLDVYQTKWTHQSKQLPRWSIGLRNKYISHTPRLRGKRCRTSLHRCLSNLASLPE